MASTYSTNLRLELMASGDQNGTWGTTTNTNLGTLLEQAISGVLSVAQGDVANLTLTATNGGSDQARNAVLDITGAMTANRNVVVPTVEKLYLVKNSTTGGFDVTFKTAAGTGVAVPSGGVQWVYCDGVNVEDGQRKPVAASLLDVRRNRVTNPSMQLSQENGDTLQTANNAYLADQFAMSFVTSGVVTGQRVQVTTPSGALDRLRLSVTTADTSLTTTANFYIVQNIEANKISDARFGTADAVPFVHRVGINAPEGTYAVALTNHDGTRSCPVEYSISAGEANTDVVKTIVFPADTSGTWVTGTVRGASLYFMFACGSTLQGTAGVWQSGIYLIGTSTMSNGLGAVQDFDVFDIGLYLDPDSTGVAPQFEVPSYMQNEIDCMRFYETGAEYRSGTLPSGTTGASTTSYKVKKRNDSVSVTWVLSDLINVTDLSLHHANIADFVHFPLVTAPASHSRYHISWTANNRL